jgi:hypothetical protein
MERAVEVFATIHFSIIGLSHLVYPDIWVDFFIWLRERGRPGVFVHGFLSLGFGSIIVAFHPVWSGLPLLLTILGWFYLLKAFMCFVVPASQTRTLARVSHERGLELRIVGVVYLVIAGLMVYLVAR